MGVTGNGQATVQGSKYGGEGVLLVVVLACSWFHHPNPLITLSVVLSVRVFNKPVTLFMCCAILIRSDSIVNWCIWADGHYVT
jgi:hypothetical protein